MGKANEVLRVGMPVGANKLKALIEVADLTDNAEARYDDGQIIIEEPHPRRRDTIDPS